LVGLVETIRVLSIMVTWVREKITGSSTMTSWRPPEMASSCIWYNMVSYDAMQILVIH
jgi:hypothetical protein